MNFIEGFDRNQLLMMDFESAVSQNSWARVVDLFVEMLPLKELGFKDALKQEGRPPYCSSDLLKLYIYGYKKSITLFSKTRAGLQGEHGSHLASKRIKSIC